MNEKVKEYIEKQKPKQKKLLQKARKLILKTIPKCNEDLKWGVLSYCGGKIYLVVLKDKIHVGFSILGLTKEEIKIFEGSGKTARHIKIYSEKELKEKQIAKLVRMVNKKTKIPD